MDLSRNFTLDELVASQTAARLGLSNAPPAAVVAELRRLAQTILQPLRDRLGRPVVVSSGYRSASVNAAVGGALASAHMSGRAADIIVPGLTPLEVCLQIKAMGLPYHQVIHEFRAWCHVAIAPVGTQPHGELLTAIRGPVGVYYEQGLV
ncbi:MAG: hypothetical protein RJA99_4247 [Pseudomonadota bacterium]|jgi:hypothetical protein